MSAPRIVVFPVFVCYVSFLKYSKSEKPEDCKKGKQYWSISDILSSGTCAPCPTSSKSCYEQPIEDQESCVLSCRAKTKPKASSTTITSTITLSPSQPTPSKVPKITINSNGSLAVVYQSAKHAPELNEVQKSHVVKEGLGKEALIVVGCFCGLVLIIFAAILLYRQMRKNPVGHRDEAEGGGADVREEILPLDPSQDGGNDQELEEVPQHPLEMHAVAVPGQHPLEMHAGPVPGQRPLEMHAVAVPGRTDEDVHIAIQDQLSNTRIGGIQDTEERNFSSALKLDEKYY